MEATNLNEWLTLQNQIRGTFRSLSGIDHRGFTELLQYAIFPSFSNYLRLDILQRTKEKTTIAYRTTWDFHADVQAFSTPIERLKHPKPFAPSIETVQLDVGSDELVNLVAMFDSISIPIVADHACGLDGTSYELQLGSYFGWCRLKWWATMPKQWKPLIKPVKRLDKVLRLFPVPTNSG